MTKIAVAVMVTVAAGALMSAQQPKSFYDVKTRCARDAEPTPTNGVER